MDVKTMLRVYWEDNSKAKNGFDANSNVFWTLWTSKQCVCVNWVTTAFKTVLCALTGLISV